MKREDPFKNTVIKLFIFNLGEIKNSSGYTTGKEKLRHFGLEPYDGEILDTLPKINFLEILKPHFGEIEKKENHCTIIRDDYKIYYYHNNGVKTNFTELEIVGKQAIVEILELSKIHNWAVMTIGTDRELFALSELSSYGYQSLEAYFGEK